MMSDEHMSEADLDIRAMAETMYGEARGEGADGMLCVGLTLRNRAKNPGWWGNTVRSVAHKSKQFSCWNDGDPNKVVILQAREMSKRPKELEVAYLLAGFIMRDLFVDITYGSTHYHHKSIKPYWAPTLVKQCIRGDHIFYK